jgi:hypothetical protein
MTAVDDLKPGMWVAVIAKREEESPVYSDFPFFSQPKSHVFDGFPLRILAVSLPFVAVDRGGSVQSIDIRKFTVQELNRQYVNVAAEFMPAIKVKRKRRRKEKPDDRQCQRCGARIIQRRMISADPAKQSWFYVCSGCGREQGEVPNA